MFSVPPWLTKILLAGALLAGAVSGRGEEPRPLPAGFLRGMTVSCQTWGWEWGTPEFGAALDRLKGLGVTHVAIHPYAQVAEEGGVRFRPAAEQMHLVRALAMARERGLGMLVIPHLGYWGTRFKWRGAIWFERAEQWDRFFDEYEEWTVGLARLAQEGGATLFCVGHEYDQMIPFETRWRRILAGARREFAGPVCYHANWTEYWKIPWWDACDFIGIGAYFILSETPDPTAAELTAAWGRLARDLGAYARKQNRPVVFTEIGYNESDLAAAKPWEYASGGANAAAIRARCVEAALALEGARFPELRGMFWWKWFPDLPRERRGRENFDMRDPAMVEMIRSRWGKAAD